MRVVDGAGAYSQTEKGAAVGGLGFAAIGAAVANDPVQGAVVGGAVGAVAGALMGRANEPDRCPCRDRYGKLYAKVFGGAAALLAAWPPMASDAVSAASSSTTSRPTS